MNIKCVHIQVITIWWHSNTMGLISVLSLKYLVFPGVQRTTVHQVGGIFWKKKKSECRTIQIENKEFIVRHKVHLWQGKVIKILAVDKLYNIVTTSCFRLKRNITQRTASKQPFALLKLFYFQWHVTTNYCIKMKVNSNERKQWSGQI